MLPPKLESATKTTARMPIPQSVRLLRVAVPTPLQSFTPKRPESPMRVLASAFVATLSLSLCFAGASWVVFVALFP